MIYSCIMIAIIGAGISGLSVGYYLQQAGVPFMLVERSQQVGGSIRSLRQREYLFEAGPNSLIVDEELMALLRALNLEKQLLEASPASKKRYILRAGKYRALPSSPLSLLLGGFFSWQAKWKIISEMFYKGPLADEHTLVADFFRRHFGQEVVDYVVSPFVSGIYAGDAEKLLLGRVFPQLLKMEHKHRSLLKAFIHSAAGQRRRSVSFREGMQTLPNRMADVLLDRLLLGVEVVALQRTGQQWLLLLNNGTELLADAVVLAVDAPAAVRLLPDEYAAARKVFARIEYAPLAVVHTVYYRHQFRYVPEGFGGLHPQLENAFALGSIWSSSLFEGRCKENELLMTTFVGGSTQHAKLQYDDRRIMHETHLELKRLFGIKGLPVLQRIHRWQAAIPQYHDYMPEVEAQVQLLAAGGIHVCANWVGGVSIPDCIRKAKYLVNHLTQANLNDAAAV